MSQDMIVVLDFGSQYTHLIKVAFDSIGVPTEIVPADLKYRDYVRDGGRQLKGVVFSGGASSVKLNEIAFDRDWLETGLPVLGLCYGHQLLASLYGGSVGKEQSEFGDTKVDVLETGELFAGVEQRQITVWMSHNDSVLSVPDAFRVIARSASGAIAALEDPRRRLYSLQFHPEVSHTESGTAMLTNFAFRICGAQPAQKWTPQAFVEQKIPEIKAFVKDRRIIVGLSGGVDSYVMTKLIRRSVDKDQLVAIYVDSGLMPTQTEFEVERFCADNDIHLQIIREADRFFGDLTGVTESFQKCKVIGKAFIDAFEVVAKQQRAEVFAQGTIWSDVVESGVTKFSSQIKPHHNVGGLPERLNFDMLEPLRYLFKDQVRKIGAYFDLPDYVVHKKVFPGPGFAIRVQGEVTRERVALVRQSTEIVEDVINNSPVSRDVWMAFSILVDVPSLGVKGDKHVKNEQAIVIRAVESTNSMTANFSRKVFPYLAEISKKITDQMEIGRVVYDITDKPPATIEWQ